MLETPRHHIKYPAGTDLVKNASTQFQAMAESIDNTLDVLPEQVADAVTTAAANTKKMERRSCFLCSCIREFTGQWLSSFNQARRLRDQARSIWRFLPFYWRLMH